MQSLRNLFIAQMRGKYRLIGKFLAVIAMEILVGPCQHVVREYRDAYALAHELHDGGHRIHLNDAAWVATSELQQVIT